MKKKSYCAYYVPGIMLQAIQILSDNIPNNSVVQLCTAQQWGYILRNALLGDFVTVQTA